MNATVRKGSRRRPPTWAFFALSVFLPPVAVAESSSGPGPGPGRVPAYVLELPDTVADVFVADTGRATLYRYTHTSGTVSLVGDGYMSIGQNGAGKERAWDRRTPIGVYFVVDQLDTTRMPDKYGATAFPLDYPNEWDRRNGRSGDGIWVHGVPPGDERRPALDTDGCIALPNEDLGRLEDRFVPLSTPVIIARDVSYIDPDEAAALRRELREALDRWVGSVASADLHAYLSLYAETFSYRGMSAADWAALKLRTFSERGPVRIEVDELFLLGDPQVDDLYLSRFRQTIVEDGRTRRSFKRLYWRRAPDSTFRIVAEDNG